MRRVKSFTQSTPDVYSFTSMKFLGFEVLSDRIIQAFFVAGQLKSKKLNSRNDYRVSFTVIFTAIKAYKSSIIIVFYSFFVIFAEGSPARLSFSRFQFIFINSGNTQTRKLSAKVFVDIIINFG